MSHDLADANETIAKLRAELALWEATDAALLGRFKGEERRRIAAEARAVELDAMVKRAWTDADAAEAERDEARAEIASKNKWLPGLLAEGKQIEQERAEKAEAERDDLQSTFDLRHTADIRAIERWRAAGGDALTLPDHADLVVWLMGELAASLDDAAETLAEETVLALETARAERDDAEIAREQEYYAHAETMHDLAEAEARAETARGLLREARKKLPTSAPSAASGTYCGLCGELAGPGRIAHSATCLAARIDAHLAAPRVPDSAAHRNMVAMSMGGLTPPLLPREPAPSHCPPVGMRCLTCKDGYQACEDVPREPATETACGACAEVEHTGVTTNGHTCPGPHPTLIISRPRPCPCAAQDSECKCGGTGAL